jgi:hypothetical protein
MNTEGIPSCEWPDAKRAATFRNSCDKDGRLDKNLQRRAAENRIEAIARQLDCPHGLTNKERRALWNERQRFERMIRSKLEQARSAFSNPCASASRLNSSVVSA